MNTISVIVPTYNGERFVRQCLESIFQQKRLPDEIIVVDDNSTDGTLKIVREESTNSPVPFHIIQRKTNSGGPAQPMNAGVQASLGEVVAFIDQDDLMDRTKLERSLNLFSKYPQAAMAFGQYRLIDENDRVLPPRKNTYSSLPQADAELASEDVLRMLMTLGYRCGGSGGMVIRKTYWEQVYKFNSKLNVLWDYDFTLRIALTGYSIAYSPNVVYYHRIHDNNLARHDGNFLKRQEKIIMLESLIKDLDNTQVTQRKALKAELKKTRLKTAKKEFSRRNIRVAIKHFYNGIFG